MARSSKPAQPDSYPVAADLDALVSAKDRLIQQAAAVDELLRQARLLASPMRDGHGHGRIAGATLAAFHERAGEAQGVVRALTDYRDELTKALSAIQQTMDSYGRGEVPATRFDPPDRQRVSSTSVVRRDASCTRVSRFGSRRR